MVAYDELGTLVPIKRTLQVIDLQNQANKELEVRGVMPRWNGSPVTEEVEHSRERCVCLCLLSTPSPKAKSYPELLSLI